MKQRLLFWWGLRTTREQRLLLVMAALAALVLIWLLVIRPVGDALADARARHGRAVIALAEAQGQADAIARLEHGGPAPPQIPVNLFVGQKASEAGLTLERIEPQGADRVAITIAAVRPQAFFAWASALERQNGLIVDTLSARTNSDRTLAVEASVRARRR